MTLLLVLSVFCFMFGVGMLVVREVLFFDSDVPVDIRPWAVVPFALGGFFFGLVVH